MKKLLLQQLILLASDGIALCLSLLLAIFCFNLINIHANEYIDFNRLGVAKLFGAFILVVFWWQEHYTKRRPVWEELKLVFIIIAIFALIHFCAIYLISHHITKTVNILFWLILLFILPSLRHVIKLLLLKMNLWKRDVYIIGTGLNAYNTFLLIQANHSLGYNILGFIDEYSFNDNIINNKILFGELGIPIISDVSIHLYSTRQVFTLDLPIYTYQHLLFNYLDDSDYHNKGNMKHNNHHIKNCTTEIIFALDMQDLSNNSTAINYLQTKYQFISIIPDILGLPLYGASMEHFFGSYQLFLRLQNNLSNYSNICLKRICDITLTVLAILLLSPILLSIMCYLQIRYQQIFFKHKRIGQFGNSFNCLKFQTMYANSQEILTQLLANNPEIKQEWQQDFKLKNDPRITKIGKFLRKTSLDELPQLFNVLKGEMSLIGPRPIIQDEAIKYGNDIYYYQLVKPGITGLWQISGRNNINYQQRVYLDVWYVKNWSLWHDFIIILRTILIVLKQTGAY